MYKALENLQPAAVWRFFNDILQIPRPSKHEEKITRYLIEYGVNKGFETLTDDVGNVLIRKPATKGNENRPWVCLQSHIDMVCEKNNDKDFDFQKDAIVPVLKGEWLHADGTTLGADDGIGVATALAILDSTDIEHGPLECLFTVDEETGLTGASALKNDWLKSRILLNLDDEDLGEICVGCAGGIDTVMEIDYKTEAVNPDTQAFVVKVSGLKGGHSGDDINKGLGCANKLITRVLWAMSENLGLRLSTMDGGNLRNAIAREASAVVMVPSANAEKLQHTVAEFEKAVRYEFRSTEPDLHVTAEKTEMPKSLMDKTSQDNLLNALYACAHGVLAMSREIPNFVETSTNLASVKMDDSKIHICTSQRSSVESAKHAAASKIEATFRLIGAKVSHSDGYPGWTPNPDSKVLKVAADAYRRLFNEEPTIRAIHAGLECGLIGEKYEGMDMISFGPTLRGVHSPDERLEIATVEKFWRHVIEILKNI